MNQASIIEFFDLALNENICHELAIKHQFIKRSSSRLKGHEFIKAMIIPSKGLATDSLQGICDRIKNYNPQASITSQALCQRINNVNSVELMKNVLANLIKYKQVLITNNCPKVSAALDHFNSILIEDSTVMKLNEVLQDKFPGINRGVATKSQVKIDLIFDLKADSIVDASIYSGKSPDQGLASRIIKYIHPGDLIIRDLGYFVLKSLKIIEENEGYYLSRMQSNLKIYLNKDDTNPIDLEAHLRKHYPNMGIMDLGTVFISDIKFSTRMVIYRLPEDVVAKRLREANKNAKEKGRTMSQNKKKFLRFAVFVTNVPKKLLAAEVIGTIYRLRWEIELIFKRWKSQLEIDYLKGIDKNRIECLIWSRMCMVILVESIVNYATLITERMLSGREISHVKVINYIIRDGKLCTSIINHNVESFFNAIIHDISKMLLKDRRKRTTMREKAMRQEHYYSQAIVNMSLAA